MTYDFSELWIFLKSLTGDNLREFLLASTLLHKVRGESDLGACPQPNKH